jgi:hypothetical protein
MCYLRKSKPFPRVQSKGIVNLTVSIKVFAVRLRTWIELTPKEHARLKKP